MSVIIGGIACEELPGSKEGNYGRDGARATRVFKCDWGDRGEAVAALLGATSGVGEASTWERPLRFSASSYLYVANVNVKGWKQIAEGSDGIEYEKAILTVSYEPLDHDPDDDDDDHRWATVSSKSRVEFLQIPGWGLRWHSDGEKFDEDAPATHAVIVKDIVIARYNVRSLPITALDAATGKLNSASFINKAAKTLLFAGWDYERSINETGQASLFTVTIELKWRKYPWDQAYRPGTGWAQYETTAGTAPFETTDFNSI